MTMAMMVMMTRVADRPRARAKGKEGVSKMEEKNNNERKGKRRGCSIGGFFEKNSRSPFKIVIF